MFDFIITTGTFGVLGICAVFVVVFILAEPGKEISFWGIKFHKKYSKRKILNWRRMPKHLPREWIIVLRAFADLDHHHINESNLYEVTKQSHDFTELKTRGVCSEMSKYNLIHHFGGYVSVTDRALPLINNLDEHKIL